MVKVYRHTHRYDDPPSTTLLAFYLRYPNPFASHVLSCDVISRSIDPVTGTMKTTRLMLKKGMVPKWARSWLEGWGVGGGGLEAWVLEESEVQHHGLYPSLISTTRNISHKKLMQVVEGTELVAAARNRGTLHKTTAHIVSDFLPGTFGALIRGRIEAWGENRFQGNMEKAREGMSLILSLLRSYQPLPQTSEAVPSGSGMTQEQKDRAARYSYKATATGGTSFLGGGAEYKGKGRAVSEDEDEDDEVGLRGREGEERPRSFFMRYKAEERGEGWVGEGSGGEEGGGGEEVEEERDKRGVREGGGGWWSSSTG